MIAIMERAQLVKPKNIVVDLVDIPKAPSGGLVIKVCNILMRGFLQLPAFLFFEQKQKPIIMGYMHFIVSSATVRSSCFAHPISVNLRFDLQVSAIHFHFCQVAYSGICHSDLHQWEDYLDYGDRKQFYSKNPNVKLPLVPGHEMSGFVYSIGPNQLPSMISKHL